MIDEYNILRKKKRKNNGFATTALLVSLGVIILLVAIFVFLLGKVDKKDDSVKNEENTTQEVCDSKGECTKVISCGTKEQIFNENLRTIKDAAVSYFTLERMPKNKGDVKKITLSEMQKDKMVLSIIDSKSNACYGDKSYVEVTKDTNEYVMKIYLSCSDMEDYIIIHLGCYDYCKGTVCEKQDEEGHTEFEYEYKKTTACTMSDWSNWGAWKTTRETTSNLKKEDVKTETIKKTVTDTIDLIKGSTNISCTQYGSEYKLTADKNYCVKYGTKVESVPGTPTNYTPYCEDNTYKYNTTTKLCEKNITESGTIEKTATKNPDTFDCSAHPGTVYNSKTGKCEGTISTIDKKPINVVSGTQYCSNKKLNIVNGECVGTETDTKPAITTSSKSCSEYGSNYKQSGDNCVANIKTPFYIDKEVVYGTKVEKEEYACWKLEGTTKTVFDCSTGSCKMVPQTSYEKVWTTCTKDVTKVVETGSKCPDGTTESGNLCVKYIESTDTKPAKVVTSNPTCSTYGSNYSLSSDNKNCVGKITIKEKVLTTPSTINCDPHGSSYSIKDGYCVANISIPVSYDAKKNTTTYNCNSLKSEGYNLVSAYTNKCVKNYSYIRTLTMQPKTKSNGITCKEGYTPNGTSCERNITVEIDRKNSIKTVISDKCPDGYKQNGTKCTKDIVKEEKVTYYRYATRTCNGGTTDIKWSYSNNDKSLLDNGYTLTGNKKEVKETFKK